MRAFLTDTIFNLSDDKKLGITASLKTTMATADSRRKRLYAAFRATAARLADCGVVFTVQLDSKDKVVDSLLRSPRKAKLLALLLHRSIDSDVIRKHVAALSELLARDFFGYPRDLFKAFRALDRHASSNALPRTVDEIIVDAGLEPAKRSTETTVTVSPHSEAALRLRLALHQVSTLGSLLYNLSSD